MESNIPRFLRIHEVLRLRGCSRSTLWRQIREGTYPPLIEIGQSGRALPDYEAARMQAAAIAGKTNDELRALVSELVAMRKSVTA